MKKLRGWLRQWLGVPHGPDGACYFGGLPEILVHPYHITVRRGQNFTVWLDRHADALQRDAIQIELRVRGDGTPEVFASEPIKVMDFAAWTSAENDKVET